MKEVWSRYAARFDALSRRERGLIGLAVLAFILLVGYVLLIEPSLSRQRSLRQQLQQQSADLHGLREQVKAMQAKLTDPDAGNRASLERVRRAVGEADERLKSLQSSLVAPEQMAGLLDEILRRNRRLQLVALRSLPASPLIERKEAGGKDGAGALAGGNIFRHGVEITVSGGYGELMAYMAELEKLPQQMFWNAVKLKVDEYPRATLTLTVYTLSLDKAWLII